MAILRSKLIATVTAAATLTPLIASAQAPAKQPEFAVVSIRENTSGISTGMNYGPTADGFHAKNMTLGILVLSGFAPSSGGAAFFNPQQIINLPDWMRQGHYDIDARVAPEDIQAWQNPANQPALQHTMLEQLLKDRMKFAYHREMKEVPVYELTVSKGGLKAGVKPSKIAPDVAKLQAANPHVANLPGGAVVAPGSQPGEYIFYGATMASLGVMLQNMAGRPIQDHTGLSGRYDFTVHIDEVDGDHGVAADMAAMLSTAIDQLGLKLQPAKGQVETLVIDHVEKPTEN